MIEVKEIKENVYDDTYDKKLRDELIDESLAGISSLRENFNKMYGIGQKAGLEAGRAEAWDCARKLILSPWDCDGALGISTVHKFFNGLAPYDVLMEYSAKDVKILIDMLNEKGKDINAPTKKDVAIGDEVRDLWGTVGIVVGVPSKDNPNYSVACWDTEKCWYCTDEWTRDEFVLTQHCLDNKENALSSIMVDKIKEK